MIVGDDGYVDTVYVGDLLGNFYGLKFNFDTQVMDATSGARLPTLILVLGSTGGRPKRHTRGIRPSSVTQRQYGLLSRLAATHHCAADCQF